MQRLSTPTLAITAVIQAFILINTLTDSLLSEPSVPGLLVDLSIITPWWLRLIQMMVVPIAAVVIFLGLQVQHFRLYLGLWMVTAGCIATGLTLTPLTDMANVAVLYEAWFIGAFVLRHRAGWLTGLVLGSTFFGLVIGWRVFLATSANAGLSVAEALEFNGPGKAVYVLIVLSLVTMWICLLVTLWLVGSRHLRRAQEIADLKARAELSALRERQRIAREMHDIVAHSLTVVIAQADGGRFAGAKNPQLALEALATISEVSRDALTEMRGLLSVLRSEDDDGARSAAIQPGWGDISELVERGRQAGLEVELVRLGEEQLLSQAAQLHIYRVVQECLTNVLKHAGGVKVRLAFDWESIPGLILRVDSAAPLDPKVGKGSGKGLKGIAERARLMGGTASWGPSNWFEDGWAVEVYVPLANIKAKTIKQ